MLRRVWNPGTVIVVAGILSVSCTSRETTPAKLDQPPAQTAAAPPAETSSSYDGSSTTAQPIPPYYPSAEAARPFPALVPAAYFHSVPLVERAYRAAAEIPGIVAQQPCYCYCDKFGHRSLLDCYASDHGAG